MPRSQKFILVSFALVLGVGFGFALSNLIQVNGGPSYEELFPVISHTPDTLDFKAALTPLLVERFGSSTVGYEPSKVMYVYPGIKPEDFNQAKAKVGNYEFKDGFLWYVGEVISGEEDDLSDEGFAIVYKNIQTRVGGVALVDTATFILNLQNKEVTPVEIPPTDTESPDTPVESPEQPTMCTMDVKTCSDGSFVGRQAPGCAFAACPDERPTSAEEIVCTPEQREAEACIEIYAPVCASYQVQCITTPCNPVPKSYSNSCFACADNNVISYTDGGVCASDPLSSE